MTTEERPEDVDVYEVRRQKLAALRQSGFDFPNDFKPQHRADDILKQYAHMDKDALLGAAVHVTLAGRIVLKRVMGKASFIHIQDATSRIQVYARGNELHEIYEQFKHWDLGDIIGVGGILFKTNTGELSIHADFLQLLTKSLRPLPDKFHGLTDQEMRYRKRYVDLIANEETKKVFVMRSKIVSAMRQFMDSHGFLEVETPMMHPIPGGAIARPFITHHNTLDCDLFLRIAPELYLKRLIVGGFEKVYEINRNFRNEGISTRHNPEFTMIEFYQAYADYKDFIFFTEKMLRFICDHVIGTRHIMYQGHSIDFAKPFLHMTILEAILHYCPDITLEELQTVESTRAVLDKFEIPYHLKDALGQLQMLIFEEKVEHQLIHPTFITGFPTEVSPLARRMQSNPCLTDRFELFIAGRELANGFSELNDAEDQAERFLKQVEDKEAGDHEAMHYDSDYIEALEYGMPPTAGEGIGIDRLVMLFADAPSIRDVILFPQLRQ